jgi:predicted metal-binding protein
MSRSRPGPGTVVLLCRGCCCGTRAKHPRTDHDAQQLALEDAAASQPDVALRVVDCLDDCERGNVAVLRRPAVLAKDRDTWLGGLLTEKATAALAAWMRTGGTAELPAQLAGLRFRRVPPRRRGSRR